MVDRGGKMADLAVARTTVWAVLRVRQGRSLMASAAIMVLCSERYRHLVHVPRNRTSTPGISQPPPGSLRNANEREIVLAFWDDSRTSGIVPGLPGALSFSSYSREMVPSKDDRAPFARVAPERYGTLPARRLS